jgi:AraC-like DNA-binding protein
LLLLGKNSKSIADRYLMLWLLVIGAQLLFYLVSFSTDAYAAHPLSILGFSLSLVHAPIMYLYIYSLTHEDSTGWLKSGIHLLAYIFFNATVFYYYLGDDLELYTESGFIQSRGNAPAFIRNFIGLPLAISGATYALWSFLMLLKHQKALPQYYSTVEQNNLTWLKWLTIASAVFFVFVFVTVQYGMSANIIAFDDVFILVGFGITTYVFCVGYYGLRQATVFMRFDLQENDSELTPAYRNSALDEPEAETILVRLHQHMKDNRPFLDENLTLPILAAQIDCTANKLSQVINRDIGLNFYNYVNTHRIDLVKKSLTDKSFDESTILDIAFESGFRSKASFNKIFKKMAGTTPSQYRKSQSERV